jgi:hypothetical protein
MPVFAKLPQGPVLFKFQVSQMSTRDCTPQKFDRVTPNDGHERPDLPAVDRVSLLKEGATINRFLGSASADRFLPNVTFDQRSGGNFVGQFDPRYGGDQGAGNPIDSRYGGDPRSADPRYGGDPRLADPRYGGDSRSADPRYGGDPRLQPSGRTDDQLQSAANGPESQSQDHTVQRGDSLWKIARNALTEAGEPAGARDIMKAIQGIVEASKAEHPSLASNPNMIQDGWHLKVPIGSGRDPNRDSGSDLYQFGGDQRRGGTRYDGGDPYSDQRSGDGNDNSAPYGEGPGEFRGRRHHRRSEGEQGPEPYRQQERPYQQGRDGGRNPYDRNPYDRNPYERSPYDVTPDDRNYQNGGDPNRRGRNPYERNFNQYDRNPDDNRGQNEQPYNSDAARGPLSGLSMALKDAAMLAARGMQTIGRCAAGVQVALAKIGHGEFMGSGNAWDMGSKMARSGKFDQLPLSEAREGDVIVRSWNRGVIAQHGGKNWGDIVVVTAKDGHGNLMGANDHHGRIQPDGGRYCNSYVLRCRA